MIVANSRTTFAGGYDRHQQSLAELLPDRAGHFLRSNVLHALSAAVEIDTGFFALAFGNNLHLETAFFAAEHVARGGILGVGVAHG